MMYKSEEKDMNRRQTVFQRVTQTLQAPYAVLRFTALELRAGNGAADNHVKAFE